MSLALTINTGIKSSITADTVQYSMYGDSNEPLDEEYSSSDDPVPNSTEDEWGGFILMGFPYKYLEKNTEF